MPSSQYVYVCVHSSTTAPVHPLTPHTSLMYSLSVSYMRLFSPDCFASDPAKQGFVVSQVFTDMLLDTVLPAFSFFQHNVNVSECVWALLKPLSYENRYVCTKEAKGVVCMMLMHPVGIMLIVMSKYTHHTYTHIIRTLLSQVLHLRSVARCRVRVLACPRVPPRRPREPDKLPQKAPFHAKREADEPRVRDQCVCVCVCVWTCVRYTTACMGEREDGLRGGSHMYMREIPSSFMRECVSYVCIV
jgi:hypothetical protein